MSRLSDKPNEPMGTCDYPGGKIPHTERRCLSPADWKPLPTAPVDAPPSDTSLLCADCKHPKNDSRFHLEAPGDNWGAALHHFVPAAPAQEDLEQAIQNALVTLDECNTPAADWLRSAAQAERQVAQKLKCDACEETESLHICDSCERTFCDEHIQFGEDCSLCQTCFVELTEGKGDGCKWHNSPALPAERVSAEELAKLVAKWRKTMKVYADCEGYEGDNHGDSQNRGYFDALKWCADELEAALRPTHTPESGENTK